MYQKSGVIKGQKSMYQPRRPNFDRCEDTSKPWAKTGAWFLGPKADNGDIFRKLALEAIDNHIEYRRSYYPCDPFYVTDVMRQSESFQETIKKTKEELENMQKELHKAVPFFSSRYKGHVVWDTVMPANLGYITAMLFNQNNCASEASTVTSKYEVEVGRDLSKMVGFDPEKSMGHIVTGGTVANIEAMWVARNIKFYPVGLQDAIKHEEALSKAKDYMVSLPYKNKELRIVDVTKWDLLNLDVDEIIQLPEKVAEMAGISTMELSTIMSKYSFECIGHEFCQRHNFIGSCYLASSTAHISLFKGATILGMGKNNLVLVPVDENARMDTKGLRDILEDKLGNKVPVICVIVVMGTTEQSAVDPLTDVFEIQEEMRRRGLNFMIHADGAWGGYFCSMLRTPPMPLQPHKYQNSSWFVPELTLGSYTGAQLAALCNVDTITIDPHKTGFCPYPGGAICYRDKRMNEFLNISHQVEYYHGTLNLGDVGIEGSKPGAAAAGILMAHRIIGLHKNGYGRILGECMFTSKLLYCYWTALADHDDSFIIIPTKPLPPDLSPEEHIRYIKKNIIGKSNEELVQNHAVMDYLREIGPDTMVPCFSLNLKGNTDVNLLNKIVEVLYKDLSMSDDRVSSYRFPMIVTSSTYTHHHHSTALKQFKKRLGIDPFDTTGVKYIKTTCMDPWATSTEFLYDLASIMRNAILCAIGTVLDPPVRHDFIGTGHLDSSGQMIIYYSGQFPVVSRQYHALGKIEFVNAADGKAIVEVLNQRKSSQLILRTADEEQLHEILLYEIGSKKLGVVEVDCYSGSPDEDIPFMRTKVWVVDVCRYDHFDLKTHIHREKSAYVLYADQEKAYISHIPYKQPSYLQLVELKVLPEGFTNAILQQALEFEMPFSGTPKKDGLKIVDPIDKNEYTISFTCQGGAQKDIVIEIGEKLWFDGETINNE